MTPNSLSGVVAIAGLTVVWISPVHAQEVCVVCAAPEATYRCAIEKSEKLGRFGRGGERAIQLVCAKELARQGGHASCGVRREATGAACAGEQRILSIATLLDAVVPPEAAAPAAPAPPPGPQPVATVGVAPSPALPQEVKPVDTAAAPPRTMQEMAERSSAKSKQQLKDAGSAVGGAFERTWDCLSSLFKRC